MNFFFKPYAKRQIFDTSKLKDFADDNFKFDENGKQFSKWVENTAGTGEIAHSVFKRPVLQKHKNKGLCGKRLREKPFKNHVGKGENPGNQHFLLFPHCISTLSKTEIIIKAIFVFYKYFSIGPG